MFSRSYKRGDKVIYAMKKHSTHPGPRARSIDAAARGNDYVYEVDKFWIVVDTMDDGTLLLHTRRGKSHQIDANDPKLRHPTLWERLLYHSRFPQLFDEPMAT